MPCLTVFASSDQDLALRFSEVFGQPLVAGHNSQKNDAMGIDINDVGSIQKTMSSYSIPAGSEVDQDAVSNTILYSGTEQRRDPPKVIWGLTIGLILFHSHLLSSPLNKVD